jgi:hypothetical protein
MVTVRRVYIFLVCAISLQAVTWSLIKLLRNLILLGNDAPVTSVAFQIAVIVIGLPVFLVHWLWAQRLASRDVGERESALRRLYLYGMMAGFLAPIIANAYSLIAYLLWLIVGGNRTKMLSSGEALVSSIVAMICLALMWFYHQRTVTADAKAIPETGNPAAIHRLYIFSFGAAGLIMTTHAAVQLLRWLMFQIGGQKFINVFTTSSFTDGLALLVIGLPVWLIFWNWAQRMFIGPNDEERESALRKFYLYATVFISLILTVSYATIILAGFFRRLQSLSSTGDIRIPLPILICSAIVWAYHANVLRQDALLAAEKPRQAGIHRLYRYLVAGVGLAAFLLGISGDISVFIRALSQSGFTKDLKDELAWFSAALIIGLPVWFIPWRNLQRVAVARTPAGIDERRSIVRKIYLYFYIFVATMAVLASAVYIVTNLLSMILGKRSEGNLGSNLGQAIAFILIGVAVWLYHGYALRLDGNINRREQASRFAELRVAVVDSGEEHFGSELVNELRREMPDIAIELITFATSSGEEMPTEEPITAKLAGAGLIVGPWTIASIDGVDHEGNVEIARAVFTSPARKLLIPIRREGWEWAGLDRMNVKSLVQHTVRAVKQLVEGEEVKAVRPMSAGAIVGIILAVLFFLLVVIAIIIAFTG